MPVCAVHHTYIADMIADFSFRFLSGPLKTREHLLSDCSQNIPNTFSVLVALLMDFLNTDEKKQRRLIHLPMGRFGEAIELAKAALFRE